MELRKFVTPEVVYGTGARHLTGRYARNIGAARVLLVSDPGVVAAGWTGDVLRSLEQEGVAFELFTGVTSNPRAEEVMRAVELSRERGCDTIVAVGGGSPMDCAKAVGIVLANDAPIVTFQGVDRIENPIPPLLCVPTTPGSSAEVSQFAIITDRARRLKFAIVSKAIVPDVALVDVETAQTLPPGVVACSGMGAFAHAIEAFVSNASSPLTDVNAISALSTVWETLPAAMAMPPDESARARLMLASLQAGFAFSNASLGAVHAMAHAVGGLIDGPQGEAIAMLLDHVTAFNYPAAPERHDALAARIGVDLRGLDARARCDALVAALRQFKHGAGLNVRLRDRGVTRSDIPILAQNAIADPCMATNPRRPTTRDVEALYEEAL